jgi:peroxiredoxin Q/BCP
MSRPVVGTKAPNFAALTDTGETIALSKLKGQPVVLYFYPKDDTATCTTEACEFRDSFPRFKKGKAVILGVSPDSVKSHAKFKAKYQLPFTLVSDPDNSIALAFDVWREKSMYGRTYMGIERTTFVIDAKGKVAHVFEKVKSKGHAEAVIAVLKGL